METAISNTPQHERAAQAHGKGEVVSATAAIAQLGERQTEDLKVPGSIPGLGRILFANLYGDDESAIKLRAGLKQC